MWNQKKFPDRAENSVFCPPDHPTQQFIILPLVLNRINPPISEKKRRKKCWHMQENKSLCQAAMKNPPELCSQRWYFSLLLEAEETEDAGSSFTQPGFIQLGWFSGAKRLEAALFLCGRSLENTQPDYLAVRMGCALMCVCREVKEIEKKRGRWSVKRRIEVGVGRVGGRAKFNSGPARRKRGRNAERLFRHFHEETRSYFQYLGWTREYLSVSDVWGFLLWGGRDFAQEVILF